MRRRLVVVLDPAAECASQVVQCLPANQWHDVPWDGLSYDNLAACELEMLVLAGVPDPLPALECLGWLRRRYFRGAVLAVLPRDLDDSSLTAAAAAADDCVLWPERPSLLRQRILRLLPPDAGEASHAYEHLMRDLGQANLIGRDPAFLLTVDRALRCANTSFPVLITGETGVGKEVFARAIHLSSLRRNQPFIPLDCGGIPDHLLENELFGHARGAFTDAYAEQKGLAAMAEGGTLFLDEVDSLSPAAQAKLLRFLQERQFRPLGSERYVRADVKIVAASNRNLRRLVADHQFREDLYFRLDVLHLELRPLRERPQDIPLLARHFLELYQPPGERRSFSPAALRRLSDYHWPGNVRELLNVVQRAIVFSHGPQINACDLLTGERSVDPPAAGDFRQARAEVIQGFERDYVRELLQRHRGNVTHAARDAGKERRAFGRLAKKYGLAGNSGTPG